MTTFQSMDQKEGAIYSISWAPGEKHELVSGASNGDVVFWNTTNGLKSMVVTPHGPTCVYKVAWNPLNYEHILSVGENGSAVVISTTGQVRYSQFVDAHGIGTRADYSTDAGFCSNNMREKDWSCKLGTQAT